MKFLFIILFVLVPLSNEIGAQTGSDAAIFERVVPQLRQRTRVAIKLPSYIASETETYPLYAIITVATSTRYVLELAFTQDCGGSDVCHYGMVSGTRVPGSKRPNGKAVKLVRGIIGYFVDAKCHRVCSDSTLTWQEDGHRHTVGIKSADIETLRKVANSAIENDAVAR